MMNDNSKAIIALCSHLCVGDGVKPYEPAEWGKIVTRLLEEKLQPVDLLSFTDEDFVSKLGWDNEAISRTRRLLDRSVSLTLELVDYESKGIYIVTRADKEYPHNLKQKLGNSCPPLFYCAGDIKLLEVPAIGFVGSRKVDTADTQFAQNTVRKVVEAGYAVVSGGAKGVDSISSETALECGGVIVEFLGDSMLKRLKNIPIIKAVQGGRALLLSSVVPNAVFFAGNLMARNKYIYAHSSATVVVRSDYKKGGTWNGASECLKKDWCRVLCRENIESEGNSQLIKLGATPIDGAWNPKDINSTIDFVIEDVSETDDEIENAFEQITMDGF